MLRLFFTIAFVNKYHEAIPDSKKALAGTRSTPNETFSNIFMLSYSHP